MNKFVFSQIFLLMVAFPSLVYAQPGKVICLGLPALTGDTTTSAGSCVTATGKINGTTINSVPASGNLVGTTDAQTLSNKTLSSPALSGTVTGNGTIPLSILSPQAGSIASASTVDIGASFASGSFVTITGTTPITSFGSTAPAGSWYLVQFSSTLTLTNSGTLNTFSGGNVSTSNSPILILSVPTTAGTWDVSSPIFSVSGGYIPPSGQANVANINVFSSAVPTTGIYRPSANTLGFSSNGAAGTVDSTQHWRLGGTGTPTIANNACGSTSQGTIGAGSSDRSGLVTVGTVGVTTCTISFSSTFQTNPRAVILFPANATAAATGTTIVYVSSVGTTQFVITGTALAGAAYYYMVE